YCDSLIAVLISFPTRRSSDLSRSVTKMASWMLPVMSRKNSSDSHTSAWASSSCIVIPVPYRRTRAKPEELLRLGKIGDLRRHVPSPVRHRRHTSRPISSGAGLEAHVRDGGGPSVCATLD